MLTFDLKKKMTEEKKKVFTPKELLSVKEYERVGHLKDHDALNRVGLTETLKKGENKKQFSEILAQEAQKFNQDKVFHISQIENTCRKYYLKFLPSKYYNGFIDEELPYKIEQFELAYGVKCQSGNKNGQFDADINLNNTFIMAPAENFELQERPKDPLFFYKINDEYYYLIHKWGNDLNYLQRIKSVLTDPWLSSFVVPTLVLALMILPFSFISFASVIMFIIFFFSLCICNIFQIFEFIDEKNGRGNAFRLYKKIDPFLPFKD